jgi:acetyl-CoA carboxylase biotin carboxyl carrier protein
MAQHRKPSKNTSPSSSAVDLPAIESVLEFMEKHGLEEFEYERGDLRIRLRKGSGNPVATIRQFATPDIVIASAPSASSASDHSGPAPVAGKETQAPTDAARAEDLHLIKSPIVGTFYGSASPGAEPFVKVGDHVEPGQVLCIIEAMKLMNEIESDVAGEVMRVLVENGQPVEYGEPLFAIHPHRRK